MPLQWKHPFTCIIAGPTSCGKSTFTEKFIINIQKLVNVKIDEIIYCSPIVKKYDNITNLKIKCYEEIPDIHLFNDKKKRLLVLDDMMREADNRVVDLFTKHSHHYSCSTIFLMQNIFLKKSGVRDLSLNTHYIICFKNPRDRQQILFLSRQVYPENPKFLQEAFTEATSKPHGYLLFDMTQTTPDHLRFRTNIFCENNIGEIVYVPKNISV